MTLYPHKDMTHIIKINFDITHLRITKPVKPTKNIT